MNQANITAEGCPVTEAELEAIARYSRRRLTAEEVYTFPLVLCDNDLDRDHECFTDAALEKLEVLFRGKTGIFDHDPRGEKQTARIYRCAVEEEPGRLNPEGLGLHGAHRRQCRPHSGDRRRHQEGGERGLLHRQKSLLHLQGGPPGGDLRPPARQKVRRPAVLHPAGGPHRCL